MASQELRDQVDDHKCTEFRYITEFWRRHFPPFTAWAEFNKDDNFRCNYTILKFILKSYDNEKYSKITNEDIRSILYKHYSDLLSISGELKKKINSKWSKQGKKNMKQAINKKQITLEQAIINEEYIITEMDIAIFAYFYRIPIVVYYEAKSVKLFKFNNSDNVGHYYFVKNTKDNILSLNISRDAIFFKRDTLSDEVNKVMDKNNLENFEEYLLLELKK